jgi:hypothetical protein
VTIADDALYLDYAVRWRTGDQHPGKHAARHAGTGGNFRGIKPFWQLPDARHIDVRRSLTDPFETVMVRQMESRGSLALVIAADLSASMPAATGGSHLAAVSTLAQAAARSALRAGDTFGFIGFDTTVRGDFFLAPTRARGAAADIAQRLVAASAPGRGAAAMSELAWHLPERRCLLLLLSDFLIPLPLVETALARLARHDVAPIVLHDSTAASLPRAGLVRLRDAETGATRLLLMRPRLQQKWQRARAEWRAALDRIFARHCRPAFHADGLLDIAALGAHLRAA